MLLAEVINVLVVAVIIASVSTVHATGNRIQRNGLNGPVKSVVGRVAYYKLKSGILTEQCCSTLYSFTFDSNGQVLSGGPVTRSENHSVWAKVQLLDRALMQSTKSDRSIRERRFFVLQDPPRNSCVQLGYLSL